MGLGRMGSLRLAAACGAAFVVVSTVVMITLGVGLSTQEPATEVTDQRPFADFIGREYRIVGDVLAVAWNDFPDKEAILQVVLTRQAGPQTRNRFVSYAKPLSHNQTLRIISAWQVGARAKRQFRYLVALSGSDVPENDPVVVYVGADGVPDTMLYARLAR